MLHVGGAERMSRLEMGQRLAAFLGVDASVIVAARREDAPAPEPVRYTGHRTDTSDLTRLPHQRLDDILGRGLYKIAKNRDEINRAVGNDRIGSEFYPLLVTLLACVLGLEHVLANRFYRRND